MTRSPRFLEQDKQAISPFLSKQICIMNYHSHPTKIANNTAKRYPLRQVQFYYLPQYFFSGKDYPTLLLMGKPNLGGEV